MLSSKVVKVASLHGIVWSLGWLYLDELKRYLANAHNLYVNLGANF